MSVHPGTTPHDLCADAQERSPRAKTGEVL